MEKEQKEMWKNWESWKGFNDWLNSKLKEDYIKKGILPPFTDPFGGVFTRMIPRQCLDECPKDNCILVKMTGSSSYRRQSAGFLKKLKLVTLNHESVHNWEN